MPPRRARAATLALTVVASVLAGARPAAADPPAPTDYRSTVTAVDPVTDGVEARVVGGDAFLELQVDDGHEVLVDGYGDEPDLRFRPDGTVERNRRSEATYLNDDRRGAVELPAAADNEADPEWDTVASDGTYAWHDHRIHWSRAGGRRYRRRHRQGEAPATASGRPIRATRRPTALFRKPQERCSNPAPPQTWRPHRAEPHPRVDPPRARPTPSRPPSGASSQARAAAPERDLAVLVTRSVDPQRMASPRPKLSARWRARPTPSPPVPGVTTDPVGAVRFGLQPTGRVGPAARASPGGGHGRSRSPAGRGRRFGLMAETQPLAQRP